MRPLRLGAGAGPKALKILKSVDPATGRRTWYYVEYRRGYGFDSNLSSNANLTSGVVHTGSESTGNSSYVLDVTLGGLACVSAAPAQRQRADDVSTFSSRTGNPTFAAEPGIITGTAAPCAAERTRRDRATARLPVFWKTASSNARHTRKFT